MSVAMGVTGERAPPPFSRGRGKHLDKKGKKEK